MKGVPPACLLAAICNAADRTSSVGFVQSRRRNMLTHTHIPAGFYRATSHAPDRLSALTTAIDGTMPPASSDRRTIRCGRVVIGHFRVQSARTTQPTTTEYKTR